MATSQSVLTYIRFQDGLVSITLARTSLRARAGRPPGPRGRGRAARSGPGSGWGRAIAPPIIDTAPFVPIDANIAHPNQANKNRLDVYQTLDADAGRELGRRAYSGVSSRWSGGRPRPASDAARPAGRRRGRSRSRSRSALPRGRGRSRRRCAGTSSASGTRARRRRRRRASPG